MSRAKCLPDFSRMLCHATRSPSRRPSLTPSCCEADAHVHTGSDAPFPSKTAHSGTAVPSGVVVAVQ